MTMSGFSGPACREIRQLLGVYVVGAIDPAERAIVDEHLGECQLCRDELAGLAGLPAMLSRVPAADVEWLDMSCHRAARDAGTLRRAADLAAAEGVSQAEKPDVAQRRWR